MIPAPFQSLHELPERFYVRSQLSLGAFDSSYQGVIGRLPGVGFEPFWADRAVSVDRCDRLRVVRFGKARAHVSY